MLHVVKRMLGTQILNHFQTFLQDKEKNIFVYG